MKNMSGFRTQTDSKNKSFLRYFVKNEFLGSFLLQTVKSWATHFLSVRYTHIYVLKNNKFGSNIFESVEMPLIFWEYQYAVNFWMVKEKRGSKVDGIFCINRFMYRVKIQPNYRQNLSPLVVKKKKRSTKIKFSQQALS